MTAVYGHAGYRPTNGRTYVHLSDPNPAQLPSLCPDTDYFVPSGGTLWDCPTTTTLLAAIAGAADGDVIKVYAGTRYNLSNVILPQHANWVYVFVASKLAGTFSLTSSVYHIGGTQTRGARVGYEHSYAVLGTSSPLAQFALADSGTHTNSNPIFCTPHSGNGGYWWFEGIEFMVTETLTSSSQVGLINLGLDSAVTLPTSIRDVPTHFNFGDCLIHGKYGVDLRRGIAMNAGWVGVRDCSIYNVQFDGAEAAGIGSWSSPGVFSSINNFISASAQSILFGGASPGVPGMMPTQLTTKWNWFWKDIRWFKQQGQVKAYGSKNHYEHKFGSIALVEDCVCEHNTADGQDGTNLLFQNLNDSAMTPPAIKINDITVRNIKVYGGGPLIAINGAAIGGGSGYAITDFTEQPISRFLVSNILCDQISAYLAESNNPVNPSSTWGIYLQGSNRDTVIEHVTAEPQGQGFYFSPISGTFDNNAATRPIIRNNAIGYNGDLGPFFGTGGQSGVACLNALTNSYAVDRNVLYPVINGPSLVTNPSNNGYPVNIAGVGFDANYVTGHPTALATGTTYKNYATDGIDPGADVSGIAAMVTAVKGTTTLPV